MRFMIMVKSNAATEADVLPDTVQRFRELGVGSERR
jgi:hypothetical protein